jgi:putative peptidoglycan lipid II flippase
MPFFARLWAEGKRVELGELVTRSARASAAIAAVAAWGLIALATPLVELLFHRGHFSAAQVPQTARYVVLFAVAIPLWAAQGIVARAFYAVGDTATPMVAGTLVTVASLPVYWLGQHVIGVPGVVVASGVGIFLHTAVLMVLLPRRLETCRRKSIVGGTLRAFAVGAAAAPAAWALVHFMPRGVSKEHWFTLMQTGAGGIVFITVAALMARPFGADDVWGFFERLFGRIVRRFSASR